jgi:hypothetical protein
LPTTGRPVHTRENHPNTNHGVLGKGTPSLGEPATVLTGETLVTSHRVEQEMELPATRSHKYLLSLLTLLRYSLFSDAIIYTNVFLPQRFRLSDICLTIRPAGRSKSWSPDYMYLTLPRAAEATPASRARPAVMDTRNATPRLILMK